MKKILLALGLVLIIGCMSNPIKKILPIETETKQGEIIVETEIPRTSDRDDIPAGWKPSDVRAEITTASGAKIWIPINKKKLPAMNKQAVEDIKSGALKVEQPKKSYAWIFYIAGFVGGLLLIDFALRRFLGFNPIACILGKIFKK